MSTEDAGLRGRNASETKSLLIIGAMISAIGLGVMTLAIAALDENWFTDHTASFSPLWLLAPLILAAISLFAAVNPDTQPQFMARLRRRERFELAEERELFPIQPIPARSPERLALLMANQVSMDERARRKSHRDDVLRFRTMLLSILSAGSLAFCLLLLHDLARDLEAAKPAIASHYAIALPAEAWSTPGDQAAAQPHPPVVLAWQVEGKPPRARLGSALPIALGGLFLVVLGACFPHVGLSRTDDATTTLAKLAAPTLSLALVGLGAVQQAHAARLAADERLVREGLPSTVRISERRIEHHLARPDHMAREALVRLEKDMAALQTLAEAGDSHVAGLEDIAQDDRQDLFDRLERLRDGVRHPQPSEAAFQDFGAIKRSLEAIDQHAASAPPRPLALRVTPSPAPRGPAQ